MLNAVKNNLWSQFGASIDMLRNAITLCPEDTLAANKKIFYQAYHVLVFLDYYLTLPPDGFASPLPFTIASPGDILDKEAIDDIVPMRIYTKTELLEYCQACREKCRRIIEALTEETLMEPWIEEGGDRVYPMFELLLYNMRHVQHHAAQLNMLLRQTIHNAPGWVSRAKEC